MTKHFALLLMFAFPSQGRAEQFEFKIEPQLLQALIPHVCPTVSLDEIVPVVTVQVNVDEHTLTLAGAIYAMLGKHEMAIDAFTDAIFENPKYAKAFLGRGFSKMMERDYEFASDDLAEAIRYDSNLTAAYCYRSVALSLSGQPKIAIAELQHSIELLPNDPRLLVALGACYRRDRQYYEADRIFAKVLETHPNDLDALVSMAGNLMDRKLYSRAAKYYSKASQIRPRVTWIIRERGRALCLSKRINDGLVDFSECISRNPRDIESQKCRADIYLVIGEYESARIDINDALRLKPNDAVALQLRGALWMIKKDYPKAIADLSDAICADPQFAFAYLNRSKSYRMVGLIEKADSDLAIARRLGVDDTPLVFNSSSTSTVNESSKFNIEPIDAWQTKPQLRMPLNEYKSK